MKSKQVLSVEQMKHLQELRLDTSNATLTWVLYPASIKGDVIPTLEMWRWEQIKDEQKKVCVPAFTLQDILDKLPKRIGEFELRIKMFVFDYVGHTEYKWSIIYESTDMMSYLDTLLQSSYTNLIEAAYNMLCMCIENGYIEELKNE